MGHSVCLRNSMLSPKETNARQRVLVAARIRIAEHVRDFNRHGAPSFYIATGKIVRLALICCGDCSSWLDNNFSDHRKYMLQVCEAFSRCRAASDHRQRLRSSSRRCGATANLALSGPAQSRTYLVG